MSTYDPTAWQQNPEGFMGGMALSDYDEALLGLILALPEQSSLLDVGCLCGRFAKGLRDRGYRGNYLGVDITPAFIDAARTNCPDEHFARGDVRDLDQIPSNLHDVVLCSNVLMHLDTLAEPMAELFRVAKHHVIVSLYGSPDAAVHADHFNGFLNYYYPDDIVLQAADKPGWRCVERRHHTASWDNTTIISQFHFAHASETA